MSCEYCRKEKCLIEHIGTHPEECIYGRSRVYVKNGGFLVNTIRLQENCSYYSLKMINYCPMCGERLSDE
ncbi:MAG: hypothetical protein GY782_06715 [Gammaproteobacteria bacterium]|nr:hypothetical protein [Gammaproteobacteria bacterium]